MRWLDSSNTFSALIVFLFVIYQQSQPLISTQPHVYAPRRQCTCEWIQWCRRILGLFQHGCQRKSRWRRRRRAAGKPKRRGNEWKQPTWSPVCGLIRWPETRRCDFRSVVYCLNEEELVEAAVSYLTDTACQGAALPPDHKVPLPPPVLKVAHVHIRSELSWQMNEWNVNIVSKYK